MDGGPTYVAMHTPRGGEGTPPHLQPGASSRRASITGAVRRLSFNLGLSPRHAPSHSTPAVVMAPALAASLHSVRVSAAADPQAAPPGGLYKERDESGSSAAGVGLAPPPSLPDSAASTVLPPSPASSALSSSAVPGGGRCYICLGGGPMAAPSCCLVPRHEECEMKWQRLHRSGWKLELVPVPIAQPGLAAMRDGGSGGGEGGGGDSLTFARRVGLRLRRLSSSLLPRRRSGGSGDRGSGAAAESGPLTASNPQAVSPSPSNAATVDLEAGSGRDAAHGGDVTDASPAAARVPPVRLQTASIPRYSWEQRVHLPCTVCRKDWRVLPLDDERLEPTPEEAAAMTAEQRAVNDALAAAAARRRYGGRGGINRAAGANGASIYGPPARCSWPLLWRTTLACSAPAFLIVLFYVALYLKSQGGG